MSRGVHDMLRVRTCAAHMGGLLGPKLSKQGSLFSADFLQAWLGIVAISKKLSKMGSFPPYFTVKVGMKKRLAF